MEHAIKTDKPGKTRKFARRGAWITAAIAALILAGCTSQEHVPDPLQGEIHPQQQPGNITYGPTLPSSNQNHNAAVPAMPSHDGSVSTMALASMPGGRALAIGAPQTSTAAYSPVVQAVQPDAPQPAGGSFSATRETQDILQAQLRARGVVWQKQEAVPDGVKFTCIVPNRGSTENSKIYESTARDYVSAVQAILVQIDKN